jgi:hypothetical protein
MADTLTKPHAEVSGLSVPLDRDIFLRTLTAAADRVEGRGYVRSREP